MNIIIDQPKLVRAVKLYLTKSFGDLRPKTHPKYPNLIFYVNSDNNVFMKYDTHNEKIWIDYGQIWSKLQSLFYLKYGDIQLIMVDWLEDHYGLRGVTPGLL